MKSAIPLAAVVLSACATSPDGEEQRVTYTCDHSPNITVVYAGETARIESTDGSEPIILTRRPSGSGLWYESPTRTIRSRGDEIIYTIGRIAPMTCQATAPVPPLPR